MPLTGGMPSTIPGPRQLRSILVARRYAGSPTSAPRRPAIRCQSQTARARTRVPSSWPTTRHGTVFQERRAHTQSGVVTGRPMDLLRARDGTDRRDGRVAHATLGRIAGAADTPERTGEFSGAARFAYAALCGARGGLVRTVAVGPRRGEQGHTPRDRGPRAIHVRVGQPGRPSRGRDRGKPHGQPVARAVARSARRGSRCAALPRANRTGPGATLRRDVAVLSVALRPWDRRRALAWRVQNEQAFEVRKGADGVLSEPPAVSPDGSRVAVVVRQQGKRHLAIMSADGTNSRTLAASIEIQAWRGKAPPTGRPTAPGSSPAAATGRVPGLFKIPVDGGAPVRLVTGEARNPVWSPNGDLIVYAARRSPEPEAGTRSVA